ncbi:hypothetical protein AVL50_25975 [Flammeovirga sp. SJP92]|nr:hypothetical protein AVL50_25975 [Flammeovirga sp. SJP92]
MLSPSAIVELIFDTGNFMGYKESLVISQLGFRNYRSTSTIKLRLFQNNIMVQFVQLGIFI